MGSTNHSVWNLGVETYLVEDESPEELEDLRVPDAPGVAGGVGPRLGQAALDGGRRGRGDPPGVQFRRHFGFRVGVRVKFRDNFRDNFGGNHSTGGNRSLETSQNSKHD